MALKETLPTTERPRERLLRSGAEALSLREIIGVILGSGPRNKGCLGLARDLLRRSGFHEDSSEAERSLFNLFESHNVATLRELKGLGEAGICRLLAAFELGRRYAILLQNRESIPATSLARLELQALQSVDQALRHARYEWFGFVPIQRNGSVGSFQLVAKGAKSTVTIDLVDLFGPLLALRPAGFMLMHNHPSGDLTASSADIELTHNIKFLADSFGILLLGHFIVSDQRVQRINLPG